MNRYPLRTCKSLWYMLSNMAVVACFHALEVTVLSLVILKHWTPDSHISPFVPQTTPERPGSLRQSLRPSIPLHPGAIRPGEWPQVLGSQVSGPKESAQVQQQQAERAQRQIWQQVQVNDSKIEDFIQQDLLEKIIRIFTSVPILTIDDVLFLEFRSSSIGKISALWS